MRDEDTESIDPTNCKVGQLLERYDLGNVGDNMVKKWRGEGRERTSLRSLAEEFNRALLERTLQNEDQFPVDRNIETWYGTLTGSDVSAGDRAQVRRRLERIGVDVDQLEAEFVSYQAVRTYLTKYRDVSYDEPSVDPDDVLESIRKLQGRLDRVTASKIDQLENADVITVGSPRVSADVQVFCEECEQRYDLADLIAAGGCECN